MKKVNFKKVSMVMFACFATITLFASYEKPDDTVLSITDNGTEVEFTGKAVGESTITAKFENLTLKAVVKVRATELFEGKKYITYNKPVTAYYIEYNGGIIEANKQIDSGNDKDVVVAYETKNHTHIIWEKFGTTPSWVIQHVQTNGLEYTSVYNKTEWYRHTGNGNGMQDDWDDLYQGFEYPLGNFAAYVSYYKGTTTFYKYGLRLSDIATSDDLVMPDKTDVTEFYVRSEKVMNILCDVYKDRFNGEDFTFWVDPNTGFTLKFERALGSTVQESYEVSKLVVGKPDWDGLHLRPITGDTFVDVD